MTYEEAIEKRNRLHSVNDNKNENKMNDLTKIDFAKIEPRITHKQNINLSAPVKEYLANFFGFDIIDLNKEIEKGKDIYTAISFLTNIPRKHIKNHCHSFMYSGNLPFK